MQGDRQRQAGWASEPAWVVLGIVLAVLAATALLWSSRDGEFPAVNSSDEFASAVRDAWDCDEVTGTQDSATAHCDVNGVPVVVRWYSDEMTTDEHLRDVAMSSCLYTKHGVSVTPVRQPPSGADVQQLAGDIAGWAVNGPCWSERNRQLAP